MGFAAAEEQVRRTAFPPLQSHHWASPGQGPLWAPGGTAVSLAAAEDQWLQRRSWWLKCPASAQCLRARCEKKQKPGFCQHLLQPESGCRKRIYYYLDELRSCLSFAGLDTVHRSAENKNRRLSLL